MKFEDIFATNSIPNKMIYALYVQILDKKMNMNKHSVFKEEAWLAYVFLYLRDKLLSVWQTLKINDSAKSWGHSGSYSSHFFNLKKKKETNSSISAPVSLDSII